MTEASHLTSLTTSVDFRALEDALRDYSLFEVAGIVRRELSHSDLLAFLLRPEEPHGLRATLLQAILTSAFPNDTRTHQRLTDPQARIDVHRERHGIDILAVHRDGRIVCAVENKIDTWEHSDQLTRYHDILASEFRAYDMYLLFLSPSGGAPAHPSWTPISYATIANVLTTIAAYPDTPARTASLLNDYISTIRRHLVPDSPLSALCRKIYTDHRRAIDMIIANIPDDTAAISTFLGTLIDNHHEYKLGLDECTGQFVRFFPLEWDDQVPQRVTDWTPTRRAALFEFCCSKDGLTLSLFLGPGDEVNRARAIEHARARPGIFSVKENPKFPRLFLREILSREDRQYYSTDEQQARIEEAWNSFTRDDLPRLRQLFSGP